MLGMALSNWSPMLSYTWPLKSVQRPHRLQLACTWQSLRREKIGQVLKLPPGAFVLQIKWGTKWAQRAQGAQTCIMHALHALSRPTLGILLCW